MEENQEIPPFKFPEPHEQFEAMELAPDTLGHISNNNYTNEELIHMTYRCRILRTHYWWNLMVQREAAFEYIKEIIRATLFSTLLIFEQGNADNQILFALLQRWWPTTHTFHLPVGEVGITPLDFTMLSGLTVGQGEIVPYNNEYDIGFEQTISLFPTLASCQFTILSMGLRIPFLRWNL
ncbi:hypothetical protein FRX31_029862 [Thalictrum thalictroides]|uniref:Aminotransferase-like plant mobile domain-containing protein n=1 Tax=Thalictrum thalictroides TaxID=46969 RepID=A0A7J6V7I2_THATH|nr:hypothetical protein FRX31_029862 [Thalictrum thalictroides]